MISAIILRALKLSLRWKNKRGAWVLYAGWFELAHLEFNVVDGKLGWLSAIWHLPDDGWHAVDFKTIAEGAEKLEIWACESGFGRMPAEGLAKGLESYRMQKFFQSK